MKKTLSSLTVAAVAVFAAQAAFAQSPTREEVKKETAAANKAGQIPGTGTANVPQQATGQQSPKQAAATTDTTRDARKQATAEANKAGQIPSTGTGPSADAAGQKSPAQAAATSTTTRDERKAATAAANKAGTIPATEAQMQQPKK